MRPSRSPRGPLFGRITIPSARDVATWLIAFGIAIGLWLSVNLGERTSERTLRARLDLERLPSGMVITSPVPDYVELRVVGSGLILSSVDSANLRAVLDLAGARPGTATYSLAAKDFRLPRKLRVRRVSPSHVTVQIDRVSRRSLPVRVQRQGDLREGLKLVAADPQPAAVLVSGPREQISPLRDVDTRPIELAELGAGETTIEAALESPGGLIQLGRSSVRVRIRVDRVLAERVLTSIPVRLRGTGAARWRVTPSTIELTIRGPQERIPTLDLSEDAVWVDVTGIAPAARPLEREPQFDLPPGFEAVHWKPRRVQLAPFPPAADTPDELATPSPSRGRRMGGS